MKRPSTKGQALPPELERVVQRVDSGATWSDLGLPAAQQDVLRAIARDGQRAAGLTKARAFSETKPTQRGVTALLAGTDRAARTKVAAVVANELGAELYRVDLNAATSKYIGETEKNLNRLFDAAEKAGAVLFFDEADALFGKRSEVKDAHDKYANIEVAYLLQRLETHNGLTILATNRKESIDEAFTRRIRYVVDFPTR